MQAPGVMTTIKFAVEGKVSTSTRARQLSSMFDAPPEKKCRIEWTIDLDLESEPWQVGLVVGPSGSGKTTVMKHLWGEPKALEWKGAGVIDDFSGTVEEAAAVCQAVGFNTIPAWMRPFKVLSNGEQFRVDLARRLLEGGDPIVVDEFTSVVDRQVAKIGAHAVQKYCRRENKRFVAVGCHYDVIDWLQPDWVLDMATRQFSRRLLQRRPKLECVVGRLPRSAWSLFAPYHYLSQTLHTAAQCFGLWCEGRLAVFAGILPVPVSHGVNRGQAIRRVSRVVTLPDFQGLGLAFVLLDALGADYAAKGIRFRNYPAHPAFVRAHDRSPLWNMTKPPGRFSTRNQSKDHPDLAKGGRPCATFEYVGPAADRAVLV